MSASAQLILCRIALHFMIRVEGGTLGYYNEGKITKICTIFSQSVYRVAGLEKTQEAHNFLESPFPFLSFMRTFIIFIKFS